MKVLRPYARSKLGTRMALLFELCALVPILLLSVLAFTQVIGQLKDLARYRLRSECRSISQSVVERLASLERELTFYGRMMGQGDDVRSFVDHINAGSEWSAATPYLDVNAVTPGQDAEVFLGRRIALSPLSDEQRAHLLEGKGLLVALPGRGHGYDLVMLNAIDGPQGRMIAGRINPDYLWSSQGEFRPGASDCY